MIKAGLLAPLVIIPISSLIAVPLCVLQGAPKEAVIFVFLYAGYGLPIAYAALLGVGLPGYLIATWFDAVNYPVALFTAALACVIAGLAMTGGSFNLLGSLILFAFGGPIAALFVRIVRRGLAKRTAAELVI
ncbi:hypothetical protein [Luteolibacter sp. Populi]|uniref:hypothetical protein n=1 Tax=Luteolibacter sp. Populi TaxID=3230487 RepID=UPI00346574FA